MFYASLPQRSLLRISGEEALPFLNGLVTSPVLHLPAQRAQYSAMLTPQGKFLFGFFCYWHEDSIWLDAASSRADALRQRLLQYRLRSKVVIEPSPLCVAAVWQKEPAAKGCAVFRDPRLTKLGWRVFGTAQALEGLVQMGKAGDYEAHRLELGVPDEAVDLTPERSFPLPFGFEALHAVAFDKGCYVGQEVTARTKHLGSLRKVLCSLALERGSFPPPGTPLEFEGKPVGEMLSSYGGRGLALIGREEAERIAAQGGRIQSENGHFSVSVATWFKTLL